MKQVVTPSVCQIWQRAIINNVQKGGPLTTEGKLLYSELASRCCQQSLYFFVCPLRCRYSDTETYGQTFLFFLI